MFIRKQLNKERLKS